jgi:hypothetical protein
MTPPPRLWLFSTDRSELHAGIRRAGARLMPDDVRLVTEHHLVAGPRQHLEPDLVCHRAARDEQRRFLAQQFGDPFL